MKGMATFLIMEIVYLALKMINIPFMMYFKHWCNESIASPIICYKKGESLLLATSPGTFVALYTTPLPRSPLFALVNHHMLSPLW